MSRAAIVFLCMFAVYTLPPAGRGLAVQTAEKCSIETRYLTSDDETLARIQAATTLSDAIQLDPNVASNYIERGSLLFDLKLFDLALRDYSKAIDLDPTVSGVYLLRAKTYFFQNNYAQAIEDYNHVIEAGLTNSNDLYQAYLMTVQSYFEIQEYQSAIVFLDLALSTEVDTTTPYALKARIYRTLGDEAKNAENWLLASGEDSTAPLFYLDLGFFYYSLESYEQAIVAAAEALSLSVNLAYVVEALYLRGISQHELRQYDQAISGFDQAILIDPHCAVIYDARGYAHLGRAEYSLALDDFNQALSISPDLLSAYNGRVGAYENLGDTERAKKDRDFFLENSAMFSSQSYLLFGILMTKLNEYEAARYSLGFAGAFDPNNPEVYLALAELNRLEEHYDLELEAYQKYLELVGEAADPLILQRIQELENARP